MKTEEKKREKQVENAKILIGRICRLARCNCGLSQRCAGRVRIGQGRKLASISGDAEKYLMLFNFLRLVHN